MLTTIATILFAAIQVSGGDWGLHLTLSGLSIGDNLGFDIAVIRDLDDDGIEDFIVSAPGKDDVGGNRIGEVSVYSGANGLIIFEFQGPLRQGGFTDFGHSVSSSDTNGDGYDDILIGARRDSPLGQEVGSVYVFSGKDGGELYRLDGTEVSECFGTKVIGFGDIDLDGGEDFLIYSEDRDTFGPDFGSALIYSGKGGSLIYEIGGNWIATGKSGSKLEDVDQDGWPDFLVADHNLSGSVAAYSGFDGSEIYRIFGPVQDANFGFSSGFVGDVDLDGIGDFIVGSPELVFGTEGHAYVYSGANGALLFTFIGEDTFNWFGWDVDGAGDVDGDGFPDFVVGAPLYEFSQDLGAAYIFSGFDGRLLKKFVGDGQFAKEIGWAVLGIKDLNGNNLSDVIISAPKSTFNGSDSGSVFAYTLDSYLQADAVEISAASGGIIQFTLNFPDTEGGRTYQLLASKPNPGRIGPNFNIPLVDSPTLRQMYLNPPSIFSAPIGTLDANGDALLTMTLIPGQASAYVGNICRFSAITHENASTLGLASATVDIEVMP